MNIPPNMWQFKSKIANETVNQLDVNAFEKWMGNPNKFPEELRSQAEELVKQAKALLKERSERPAAPKPVQGTPQPQARFGQGRLNNYHNNHNQGGQPTIKNDNSNAGSPEVFGRPFHNPYTFIPFPEQATQRHEPTPLTADEADAERLTGVLFLEVKTLSPLLVPDKKDKRDNDGTPSQNNNNAPQQVKALRIGNNIVLPATSVRGTLRALTALVSGSALDYVDEDLWLCQGRDTQLDRQHLYLAEVVRPGDANHDGEVKVAPASLVEMRVLIEMLGGRENDLRQYDGSKNGRQLWVNSMASPTRCSQQKTTECPYRVKVSGRKIGHDKPRSIQHEGVYDPDKAWSITLPRQLWADYIGRNRNSVKTTLKKGDLVWLEPQEGTIQDGADVKSIQWARWGKTGVRFLDILKKKCPHMIPDSLREDGLVDVTSDLFGNVPMTEGKGYEAFSARVRPENLVFESPTTFWNEMPPLGAPHPGCKAFYATNDDYDAISLEDLPRGYKVYRISADVGDKAPWLYKTQPIFNGEAPKPFAQAGKMTNKAELMKEGMTGKLRISYRSLTKEEFALLLLVLSCDLRLGGGKPLGLGHAIVSSVKAYDETGKEMLSWQPSERASVPEEFQEQTAKLALSRARLYCKTQVPVEMMRYPRSATCNYNGAIQRGGMCWFTTFASNRKNSPTGLQTAWLQLPGMPQAQQIRAQGLPTFRPEAPQDDRLYGYDVLPTEEKLQNQVNKIVKLDDVDQAVPPSGPHNPNESPNRDSRRNDRQKR